VKKAEVAKEEDLKYIFYFYRPQLVEQLWKWDLEEGDDVAVVRKPVLSIAAAGQYSYAITKDEVYSWGMGENYVLGNRDDCNEFTPYKLDPRMFENNRAVMAGCGTQHTVVLALEDPNGKLPSLNESAFAVGEVPAKTEEPVVEEVPIEPVQKPEPVQEEAAVVENGIEEVEEQQPEAETKKRSIEEVAASEPVAAEEPINS